MKYIVVIFFCVVAANAGDWCDPQWCPPGTKHVACGNDGMFSSACPKDAETIVFTQDMIDAMLDEHNKLRNQQAMGKTPGFETAKRMATMTWDAELANFAALNTRKCKMEHDSCQSTETFYLAGQNLAGSYETDNNKLVRIKANDWFKEYKNADMSEIQKHQNLYNSNGDATGHFTQVVRDEAYKIGCALTRYSDAQGRPYSLVCCNYAVSNIIGVPIYAPGPTASECKSGTNPQYPGLCSC